MRRWSFEAARIDGEAVPSRGQIELRFSSEGLVVINDVHDINAKFISQISHRNGASRLATPGELDTWPTPREAASPPLPESVRQQAISGTATIDFFIDESGRVRMPAIAGADDPALGVAAVDAVASWTFDPPTREGQPVKVRVKQPFHFRPGDGADAAPPPARP